MKTTWTWCTSLFVLLILVPSPNRYGVPAFYELHAWVWKHNSSGLFNDWNPRVRCPKAPED
jgi:hypothetical protein